MAITVKHTKVSTVPDGDDTSVVRPSDWNDDHALTGLGTMAEQNANAVAITGGTISGVTLPASNITGTLDVGHGGTGATTLTGYVKGTGTAALGASSTIPNTDITGLGTASTKDAGAALGVATLDSAGKVPISELPAAVLGALSYQGTWDASTNTPTLTSSVGTKGYYYVVSVAGNTNLNGITDWLVGDWAVFNGTAWQKIDNTDSVTSVNGLTGAVVLTTTNIAEGTNEYFTTAKARASVSAGTGISYNNTTGVITNSSPSLGGDVVGPASATDNAVARFDSTTGKLIQNSVVTVSDTGAATGFTTLSASTSVTTPIVQAVNSAGLALKNSAGTTQMSMGAGGGDNLSINVSTNLDGSNAQIDISPTGTGHVHIKPTGTGAVEIAPTSVGTMDNMTIGATTPKAITGTTITATSFVGSGASLTNVVNSAAAGTGISVSGATGAVTITNTAPDQTVSIASGTGISATGTYPAFTVTNTAPDQTVALTAGTGISTSGTYPNFTITNTSPSSGGTVTSVTGTAPVVSSGGNTPAISMAAATGSVNGYLTSTDWTTFNNKSNTNGTVTSVAALTLGTTGTDLSSTVANGTTTPVITLQVPTASATNRGALSAADWTTFNNKAPAVTYTTGYIPFGQGTTTPNQSANLFWDNTNNRLGVNQSSPSNTLDITGTLRTTGGFTLNQNYSAANNYVYCDNTSAVGAVLWFRQGRNVGAGAVDAVGLDCLNAAGSVVVPGVIRANPLILISTSNLDLYGGSALALRVFTSKGVSIGNTTDPGATNLSVTGTGKFGTTVGVGAATPSASGAGITFPATQSASTDVNTLDDYEEGTFAPVLAFGGNSVGITYSASNRGKYTKIGNTVVINCLLELTNKGSSTGAVTITNIPFTTGTYINYLGFAGLQGNITTLGTIQPLLLNNTATINLYNVTTTAVTTQLTDISFANNSYVYITMTYQVGL